MSYFRLELGLEFGSGELLSALSLREYLIVCMYHGCVYWYSCNHAYQWLRRLFWNLCRISLPSRITMSMQLAVVNSAHDMINKVTELVLEQQS